MKILLGITGSVAAIKAFDLTNQLKNLGHNVEIVATKHGHLFIKDTNFDVKIETDEDEWNNYKFGDPIRHI